MPNFAIEVRRDPSVHGYRWAFITEAGVEIYRGDGLYPCDFSAVRDARRMSARMRALMAEVDDYREYL